MEAKTIKLSDKALTLINMLESCGYEAFVVGGCVRDSLLGRLPNDWDICTNATPPEMKACFQGLHIIETGIKHGTLTVMVAHEPFEITTYRIDGDYTDGRHPDQVCFTSDLQADLSRRDFTINAMAYTPSSGLIDPFGGATDLQLGIIRCVGTAKKRFEEDGLRIMRGLRFGSQLGFSIEKETTQALYDCCGLLDHISAERLCVEFDKLLCGPGAAEILGAHCEIIARIIPEIRPMFDLDQRNQHHIYTVWDHTLQAVSHIKNTPILRLCAFFHDIGKPSKMTIDENGCGHFYRHELDSEAIVRSVMSRLRYDNATRLTVAAVILNHGIVFRPSAKQARKLLSKLGNDRLRLLIELEYADVKSQNPVYTEARVDNIRAFSEEVDKVLEAEQCFSLRDLAVSGKDLLDMGVPQGRQIGEILKKLLDGVIEEAVANEKAALLSAARDMQKL